MEWIEGIVAPPREEDKGRSATGLWRDPLEVTVLLVALLLAAVTWGLVLLEWGDEGGEPDGGEPQVAVDSSSATPEPATPSTPTESPSSSASPEPGSSEVGETRSEGTTRTTLLQVRKVSAPEGREADQGEEWVGVRARICVEPGGATTGNIGWSSWAVVDESGGQYAGEAPPWDDFPAEQLVSTGVGAGDCLAGWVLIEVPRGTFPAVASVVLHPQSETPAAWAV